jgi:hypothetical protein
LSGNSPERFEKLAGRRRIADTAGGFGFVASRAALAAWRCDAGGSVVRLSGRVHGPHAVKGDAAVADAEPRIADSPLPAFPGAMVLQPRGNGAAAPVFATVG